MTNISNPNSEILALYLGFEPLFDSDEKIESFRVHLINNTIFNPRVRCTVFRNNEELLSVEENLARQGQLDLIEISFLELDQQMKIDIDIIILYAQPLDEITRLRMGSQVSKEQEFYKSSLDFSRTVKITPKLLNNKLQFNAILDSQCYAKIIIDEPTVLQKIEKLIAPQDVSTKDDFISSLSELSTKIQEKSTGDNKPTLDKGTPGLPFIVDLHGDRLIDNIDQLTSTQILDIQLSHAQKCLDSAINQNYSEIVFIHGIGTGKLREELFELFTARKGIAKYDNSYDKRFGFGATVVTLD
ncbi:MAG: Smr/MutS family protein [Bacteroidetes bacterium]|nr:Smr/MutS family protein [Bacteroidota bacterium]